MTLSALVSDYVAFKRAIGMRFRSEPVCFKTFVRAIGHLTYISLDDFLVCHRSPFRDT